MVVKNLKCCQILMFRILAMLHLRTLKMELQFTTMCALFDEVNVRAFVLNDIYTFNAVFGCLTL